MGYLSHTDKNLLFDLAPVAEDERLEALEWREIETLRQSEKDILEQLLVRLIAAWGLRVIRESKNEEKNIAMKTFALLEMERLSNLSCSNSPSLCLSLSLSLSL